MSRRFRSWLALAGWLLGSLALGWPTAMGAAADFNYATAVTYRVQTDDSTVVSETYTVTNNTPRLYVTELRLTTPTAGVSGLKVSYDDGGDIPATTATKSANRGDINYDYAEISIKFPRVLVGQGRKWNFTLTYKATGLVESKGSAHTVYVPSIEQRDPGDSYNVTLDVPSSFGSPHFTGAKGAAAGGGGSHQLYRFDKAALTAQSLALAFGDSTVYDLNFNYPLANDSPIPRTLTIALPPDLNDQRSLVNKLDPAPVNTRLDADGNVLAEYHLAAHQHITVTTDVAGQVTYRDYDLTKSGKLADIPADLVKRYTRPSRYWQTDGAVAAAAAKLMDKNAPVADNVHKMYQFVIDKLSYNKDKVKFNIRQGAAAALDNPSNAVCLEYADLLIAMLRSQGIPARMPIGYAYSGSLKASSGVSDSLHAWVEAYVPGVGWMSVDPTWGEKFDQFGHADLDHFAFAVWGEQDGAPAAVQAGRADLGYQYEQALLTFAPAQATPNGSGTITFKRVAILPFVSLDVARVTAKTTAATDNNQIGIGDDKIDLGSLAPQQSLTYQRLVVGGPWNQPAAASFSRRDPAGTLLLAQTRAAVDYRPMLGILGLLVVVISLLAVLRLRERRANQAVRITDTLDH